MANCQEITMRGLGDLTGLDALSNAAKGTQAIVDIMAGYKPGASAVSRYLVTPQQKMMDCIQGGNQWVLAVPGQPETGVCVPKGDGDASGFSCNWKEINWCLIGGLALGLFLVTRMTDHR
jgi:hypothetical protein